MIKNKKEGMKKFLLGKGVGGRFFLSFGSHPAIFDGFQLEKSLAGGYLIIYQPMGSPIK